MSRQHRAHLDAQASAMLAAWGEPWTGAAGVAEFEAYLKRQEDNIMTVEERLGQWAKQGPTCVTSSEEWDFIRAMREAAKRGVGFGFMQQVIEWEWNATAEGGGWGPEFHARLVKELEQRNAALVAALEKAADRLEALGDGWSESVLIRCRAALKGTGD